MMVLIDALMWTLIVGVPATILGVAPFLSVTDRLLGVVGVGNVVGQSVWSGLLRLSLAFFAGHCAAGAVAGAYEQLAVLLRALLVLTVAGGTALLSPDGVLYAFESALFFFAGAALVLQSLVVFAVAARLAAVLREDWLTVASRRGGTIGAVLVVAAVSIVAVVGVYWQYGQAQLQTGQAVWSTLASTLTVGTLVVGFVLRSVTPLDASLLLVFNALLITENRTAAEQHVFSPRHLCHAAVWLLVLAALVARLRTRVKAGGLLHLGVAVLLAAETYFAAVRLQVASPLPPSYYIAQSLFNCLLYFVVYPPRSDDDE